MKMYILISRQMRAKFAVETVAKAMTKCFEAKETDPAFREWMHEDILDIKICGVTENEFKDAKELPNCMCIEEPKLKDQVTALVFPPADLWPKQFQFYSPYTKG